MDHDINPDPTRDETPADGAPVETGAATAVEDDPAELRRQRDDYYDRLLRKTAEFDNYRKRTERERRELAEFAATDLLTELLPLVDDLERALRVEVGLEGAEPYRAGVEMIHRQLLELLRKRGVTPIAAVGQPFDPHVHQAVAQEVRPGVPDGEVIEEFRRGYMIGDRLLRPSMVKVAKA
jgi:molecular chaperone GrpE